MEYVHDLMKNHVHDLFHHEYLLFHEIIYYNQLVQLVEHHMFPMLRNHRRAVMVDEMYLVDVNGINLHVLVGFWENRVLELELLKF